MSFTLNNEDESIAFLKECADAYYNTGEPIISDEEYDELYLIASQAFPDNEFFDKVGAPVRGAEVGHSTQIGGLEQVHKGELVKWLVRSDHDEEDLIASEKLDGSSLTIKYHENGRLQSGYTRGDGVTGKDVTRHVKKMNCIPKRVQSGGLEIRGEFIIKKENFEAIKEVLTRLSGKEYKNLRGIANGLINNKDIPDEVMQYLDFVAYGVNLPLKQTAVFSYLKQLGFLTPHYVVISHLSLNEDVLNEVLDIMRRDSSYEIDGIVVEFNEVKKRQSLGFHITSANPKYGFKWKTRSADNLAKAVVIGVEWNISADKYWKPTVLIEPVDFMGITNKRLSGFNAAFIEKNKVGPGAVLSITRAGDVIPHILSVDVPAAEWQQPEGNWHWSEHHVDAISDDEHAQVTLLNLRHFFQTLDIDNVGEATIQTLIDAGYDNIPDIIDASKPVWFDLIGRNGEKSFDSLHTKLHNVFMWELMAAWPYFGRGFGKRKAEALTTAFGDRIFDVLPAEIYTVDGFSEKSTKSFTQGSSSFFEFLDWLRANEYTTIRNDDTMVPSDGPLSNVKFVFTGFRDKAAEAIITSKGSEVQDGIKDDTTYLVMKDLTKTSNKTKAAVAKGVKIISIDEMLEIIK